MNGAINIRVENSTAGPIYNLWKAVSEFEETPSMQTLNYAPHFTFAIYDNVQPSEMKFAAKKAAKDLSKIDIPFSEISISSEENPR